ncbi:actin-like ATPase domain-containing protein [Ceratobasidium sp. AG-I]|nr:actin-like ATPase domain-containing protein [Ceratobasidium sp. AG-I]
MGGMGPSASPQIVAYTQASPDEGKMSVSIDFGTTFSGVAFGSSRIAGGRVQQILQWPGSFENFRKIPTCLLYNEHGQVLTWGLEAKNAPPMPGSIRCEWFKLFLEPKSLRDGTMDPRLPGLPPGKRPIDAIVDFLSCLWDYAKQQITREIGAVADLDSADVWLTVPAAWDAKGCDIMREAAIKAGLVQSAGAKGVDKNWRDRLRIITEPEAAAVHCAHLTNLHQLRPSQNFMICDAGGGTVDLAIYKILGSLQNLEIGEVCARSGANCGSLFLDLRFRDLVAKLLESHPAHTDAASLAYFQHAFSETDKLSFRGEEDDRIPFQFNCFNVEDSDDPSVGLINGELNIPGALLRTEVFDPVVSQVTQLIEDQLSRCAQKIDALLLVGGFSGSEYLFKRVDERFGTRIGVIARPADADTATCRGAARYGLANRALVSSVIAPRAYIMKVKLPAEPEDWQKRPAYITQNNAGVSICENRLQYLVQKGAILRKGQRVKTKFCKFSQGMGDSTFVAVLYTSDSERVMRYTDEGETSELCKWTVDLSTLPSFQEHARMGNQNGFYTEFELGLELDSAEVRGVLLYNGDEWGRVVFEFLNA